MKSMNVIIIWVISSVIASVITATVTLRRASCNTSPNDPNWYKIGALNTGEEVNYPIIAGSWVLTAQSRRNLLRHVQQLNDRGEYKGSAWALKPEHINCYTYNMMLTGRHVKVYDEPVLLGAVDKTPYAMPLMNVGNSPYAHGSEENEVVESRALGYGMYAPCKLVFWRLAERDELSKKLQSNLPDAKFYLVVSEEVNPDSWLDEYYSIINLENTIRLMRRVVFAGSQEVIQLEWQKVGNYKSGS